jgi:hypothetical protein
MGMNDTNSLTTPVTGIPLGPDKSSKATSVEFVQHSPKERLNDWFWKHLESWNSGDHAFVLIMVCLPLLERFLRFELEQSNGTPPGDLGNAPNFKQKLGALWGCDEADAEKCWNVLRNGILHRGMMKLDGEDTIVLVQKQSKCVHRVGNQIFFSPYILRNKVIDVYKGNTSIWLDDEYPLARVFFQPPAGLTGKPNRRNRAKKKSGANERRRRH